MFAQYWAPFVIMAVGLIWKYGVARASFSWRITWVEYVLAAVIPCLTVVPIVLHYGDQMSVAITIRNEEWRGGLQLLTEREVTHCYGGHAGDDANAGKTNCKWAHRTGTYNWTERWSTQENCKKDKDGFEHCDTVWHSRLVPADIWTPWSDIEATYSITSWFGKDSDDKPVYDQYAFGEIYIPEDARPFRAGVPIPASVPHGPPPEWAAAKAHAAAGDYLPTHKLFDYDNPVIAAGRSGVTARDYQPYVGVSYNGHPALVDHTANITGGPSYGIGNWSADEVMFACMAPPPNAAAWQQGLLQDNMVIGMVLQGDVHLVLADEHCAQNADNLAKAYKAYWTLDPKFGKRPIAKNAIIIAAIVHQDEVGNYTITEAGAETGMPYGNGSMEVRLQDLLRGQPADPTTLLGHPTLKIVPDGKIQKPVLNDASSGIIPGVILNPGPFQFVRYCMHTCSHGQPGGYWYLVAKIPPTTGAQVWMLIAIGLLSCLFWWLVAATTFIERGWSAVHAWMFRPGSAIPVSNLVQELPRVTHRARRRSE